ncbi:DUF1501 domain-containing protein [Tundrisphaera sp. TA3]|uniref:DUF1501 domain-containing protein n=1 Tax=Tundrisphaera sp. TA3 TaxID=3435775 RepID=UPI003EB9BC40
MPRSWSDCEGFHRRDALRAGVAGLLGLSLPDALRAEARAASRPRGKKPATGVIQIWLAGGPATIDMWDPKPDAPEEIRGEFRPIATAAPGISVGEHLPGMAKVMDRCSLVRSLGHSIAAHGPGTTYMATGNRPGPSLEFPAAGPLAARLLPSRGGVPPYVTFETLRDGISGTGPGFLGPAFGPFEVEGDPARGSLRSLGVTLPEGVTPRDFEARESLRGRFDRGLGPLEGSDAMAGLDRFHRQAAEILRSDRVRTALDLSREPEALRDDYGRTTLGQGALAARRLIEAGARFVTLGFGGWDTHSDNFRTLRDRLLPMLDKALSALVLDLESRGLLDETIVVCAGEFGRTPRINAASGRDHWARSMSVILAGGGFPGGAVYGSTDARGAAPVRDACSPDDLAAMIFARLGFGPRHEVESAAGRPIPIFREGRCLEPLLG